MSVTKRMRILKTVELADFAEKNAKRMGILKEREFECYCSAERIESIPIQCTFVMPIPGGQNLQSIIVFSNVFEDFLIHETMLSPIFRTSARSKSRRLPKPRISTVFRRAQKNTCKISPKSTENRMTKRMDFYKNRYEGCEVYRFR